MDFPLVRAAVPRLEVLARAPSTNSVLTELIAAGAVEPYTTILTENQTAGRGRLDRAWVAPEGASVAVSTVVPSALGGWIPLAAGLAMVEALAEGLGSRARLKWPNDVLVDGRKICGILAEWTPDGVVVGAGLNTRMTPQQLPVATATSLQIAGVEPHVDAVVARYLTGLRAHLGLNAAQLRDRVAARLDTLGRPVRVELPNGEVVAGAAVDLDPEGRIVVHPEGGVPVAVAAGDIVHLR